MTAKGDKSKAMSTKPAFKAHTPLNQPNQLIQASPANASIDDVVDDSLLDFEVY